MASYVCRLVISYNYVVLVTSSLGERDESSLELEDSDFLVSKPLVYLFNARYMHSDPRALAQRVQD